MNILKPKVMNVMSFWTFPKTSTFTKKNAGEGGPKNNLRVNNSAPCQVKTHPTEVSRLLSKRVLGSSVGGGCLFPGIPFCDFLSHFFARSFSGFFFMIPVPQWQWQLEDFNMYIYIYIQTTSIYIYMKIVRGFVGSKKNMKYNW